MFVRYAITKRDEICFTLPDGGRNMQILIGFGVNMSLMSWIKVIFWTGRSLYQTKRY